jgi:hypothetical protein
MFVCAPLRRGKTLFATRWALVRLAWQARRRKKKPGFVGQVFSNYPIFCRKTGSFTKQLVENFELLPIFDSLIVVDEAHRYYNSRNIATFYSWKHDFFAYSGQRGNDIILVSHDPGRVDTVVRELADAFFRVYNYSIFGFPIIFFVDEYSTESDYNKRTNRISHMWFFFSFTVARAYDTRQFRNQPEDIPIFPDWGENLTDDQMAKLMRPGPVREFLAALSSRITSLVSRVSSMLHRRPAVQPEDLEDNLLNSQEINND